MEQPSFYFIYPSSCVQALCEELINKLKYWAIYCLIKMIRSVQKCRTLGISTQNPKSILAMKSLTNWPSPYQV